MRVEPNDEGPGMMRELITVFLVLALIVFVAVMATSCGLFSTTEDTTRKVGTAVEEVGEAVAEVLGTVNQILLLLGGYLLGELRGPVTRFGKRVLNGRKAAKILKSGNGFVVD